MEGKVRVRAYNLNCMYNQYSLLAGFRAKGDGRAEGRKGEVEKSLLPPFCCYPCTLYIIMYISIKKLNEKTDRRRKGEHARDPRP